MKILSFMKRMFRTFWNSDPFWESPRSVGSPKKFFWKFLNLKSKSQSTKVPKAEGRCLVGFLKLWLESFYSCLPGTLKIPVDAYLNHWVAGYFPKSGPKCCRNVCAFYCTAVVASVRNGSVRKFKMNYVWLMPYHYGFVGTLSEVLYLSHEISKCVSCRDPFWVVTWQQTC